MTTSSLIYGLLFVTLTDNEEEEIKEPVDKKCVFNHSHFNSIFNRSKIAPPSKAKDAKKSISK